jgi:hypothetical protein
VEFDPTQLRIKVILVDPKPLDESALFEKSKRLSCIALAHSTALGEPRNADFAGLPGAAWRGALVAIAQSIELEVHGLRRKAQGWP